MRNILARGGVEFIAVVLGITISFWLDNQKEEWNNRKIEINLLESIISDIESIKTYNQQRAEVFELDNAVMDYVSTNWESLNVDSAKSIELAQETQKIEREIDIKYRKMSITALNEISDTKELLLMKDVIEAIEEMADKCQEVSDSFILLALSL